MVLTLLTCLLLQHDPRIERVERLLGDVKRPLHWAPLKVTVSSEAGFSGDLEARSRLGFSIVRSIRLAPGARETVILEALDPQTVVAGKTVHPVAEATVSREFLVLLDARLPYAADFVSDVRVHYHRIAPEDLEKTLSRGLLEAADLVLLREAAELSPGTTVVAPTVEGAEKAVAALRSGEASLKLVDPQVWSAPPSGGWVPSKRKWALFLAVAYAFGVFVLLGLAARRFPKFALGFAVGAAGLGIAGYAVFFPRGHLWVDGQSVEVVSERGEAVEWRVWFAGAAAELKTTLEFPRRVKPVFPSWSGAESPFTIRPGPRGCTVEGLTVGPRKTACFAGVEARPPSMKIGSACPVDLREAVWVEGDQRIVSNRLTAGSPMPPTVSGGIQPVGAAFETWRRFIGAKGIYGALEGSDSPARDILSIDLADERRRPRLFIQRFP